MATHPDGLPARGLAQDALVDVVRGIVRELAGEGAAVALEAPVFRDEASVRLPPSFAREILTRLRDHESAAFEVLLDVTAVHFPRRTAPHGEFDVVYHLLSLSKGHRLRLKVACPDPEVGVDSVVPVWAGANYMEREAFDLLGVRFNGHPDLRRMFLQEDYVGHPLRKDFPYRGH